MNKDFKIPPQSPKLLTSPKELVKRLSKLIYTDFPLTGKTRTDGSKLRKLIASTLEDYQLPEIASPNDYEIVPLKKKGIPKITREFVDTYMVTSGTTYNLQVWNRIPASNSLLVQYETGETLRCRDVRFILVHIDTVKYQIVGIAILTADYIEQHFGKFGKPTIKHQLLIPAKVRKSIIESKEKILFASDTKKMSSLVTHDFTPPKSNILETPQANEIYSIELLEKIVAKALIGQKLEIAATKNRGQALEKKVIELLGYNVDGIDVLHGAYPDIKNQLLEVKVQDKQTVDLGKYSPEISETVIEDLELTAQDVRYLIALTNAETTEIEGIIILPGKQLGDICSYVSDKSYKCQRGIPMTFFDKYKGKVVFNPD